MEWLGVAVRFGLYLDLAAALGVPFFALYARDAAALLPLRGAIRCAGFFGIMLSLAGLFQLSAAMAGKLLVEVGAADLLAVLTGMAFGTAWLVRIAALVVLVASASFLPARPIAALGIASASGAVALATLAWAGHGVMDEGAIGWLHLGADITHLLAAGIWIGALLCLLFLAVRAGRRADSGHLRLLHRALDGFAVIGSAVVAVLLLTGLVNGWLLVGPAGLVLLPVSLYGQLLLAKLALFAVMLGLAATNRYRLTPALAARIDADDLPGAMQLLRISLALETACGIVVLAFVAWLGTLQPIVSMG